MTTDTAAVHATSETPDEQRVLDLVNQLFDSADLSDRVAFLGRQFDLGLSRVHHALGDGGLGLSPKLQSIVQREIVARGGPQHPYNVGPGMAGPTLAMHGSEAVRQKFLRAIYSSEECWCQLFSEPGAGSDLAAIATRAVRDGDEWCFNGQKVWTSLAHQADRGVILARTNTEAPKHKGLTYFIIDMHQPGIEVRPLRQMNGSAEFNEVFLNDARTPDWLRIGGVDDGWRISMTTLMNERVQMGGKEPLRGEGVIEPALTAWRQHGGSPAARDTLMRLYIEAEVHRLTNVRAAQMRTMGTPGPESAIGKLVAAELNKRVLGFTMNLRGADAMLYPGYDGLGRGATDDRVQFLMAPGLTIGGGTSEVMRNVIAERTLGLPGDARTDRDVPWSALPK